VRVPGQPSSPAPAPAATAASGDVAARLDTLEKRVAELERRLRGA
jgi:uncharacterized protein YceH (UPF0502 family)